MPKIYHDRSASKTAHTVNRITVDVVKTGLYVNGPKDRDSLPREVVLSSGRILGTQNCYAYAELVGCVNHLTADECRALAEALLLAADTLAK